MQFEITPAAREYIRNKGGVITVKLEKRQTGCGCCGATEVESPSVRLGAPQAEIDHYQKVTSSDAAIYVHSSLQNTSELTSPKIDVERTLFGRKLVLYGLTQE
ncbi:CC/Se motif family (seleno)protein [Anaeroselena agilis]|uniref:CC/Se motif family (Seleno)protein n=1 Tax=Anaeroselena agilis TaxID=3063788 RepID=A0ABU3NWA3_9FIRM|nr:CC/Se motif family (seleno)protein [Selenomonadales bacterium 4137-cl]